jgi:hypothetical protein
MAIPFHWTRPCPIVYVTSVLDVVDIKETDCYEGKDTTSYAPWAVIY